MSRSLPHPRARGTAAFPACSGRTRPRLASAALSALRARGGTRRRCGGSHGPQNSGSPSPSPRERSPRGHRDPAANFGARPSSLPGLDGGLWLQAPDRHSLEVSLGETSGFPQAPRRIGRSGGYQQERQRFSPRPLGCAEKGPPNRRTEHLDFVQQNDQRRIGYFHPRRKQHGDILLGRGSFGRAPERSEIHSRQPTRDEARPFLEGADQAAPPKVVRASRVHEDGYTRRFGPTALTPDRGERL